MIWDNNNVTFKIGDIRDIATAVSIDDFMKLESVNLMAMKFPMADEPKPPLVQQKTMFDLIVRDTRRVIQKYEPLIKMRAVIY